MGKQVYLFELDSVRKTDAEIIEGQKALYDEVVLNGNIVVLTYNQLIDSRGFFNLLTNEEYQESLIELFEQGRIRISQYGDVRSIAQYLINTIQPDKKFIYSALPVKCTQKHLLAMLKRSLIYSDLSEMYAYLNDKEPVENLKELFAEVDNNVVRESSLIESMGEEAALKEMHEILRSLYWLVSTIFKLGTLDNIYVNPRDVSEYKGFKLHDILNRAVELDIDDLLWKCAIERIKGLKCYINDKDDRSSYLRELKEQYDDVNGDKITFQYAEAIINLCYNYACEISICNISKHYNVGEFQNNGDMPTFRADFEKRLMQDWRNGKDADNRYMVEETSHFDNFDDILNEIPNIVSAVRYLKYIECEEEVDSGSIHRYEYELEKSRKNQKKGILRRIGKEIVVTFSYVVLAYLLETFINYLQDCSSVFNKLMTPYVVMFLFLVATEIGTEMFSRVFKLEIPSLSESLRNIVILLRDGSKIIIAKPDAYCNNSEEIDKVELENNSKAIEYVVTPEIKKYIKYRNDRKNNQLFAESEVYQLADVNKDSLKRKIIMDEEMFGHKYGIVYSSSYNKMIVDPIVSDDNEVYPYERVVPTVSDGGVVMIVKHGDNFVLLRQFRHAIRREQYCFPRGFSESKMSSLENAYRELAEEIGAKFIRNKTELIGEINSDSGLTSGISNVYLVEVESYNHSVGRDEGIEKIIEVPIENMDSFIVDNRVDDGFTLSAYSLYKAKN